MIGISKRNLVEKLAAFALLSSSSKRWLVTAATALPNKTVLDRMLMSPSDLLQSPYIQLEHIKTPIKSTQDEARRLLHERVALQQQDDDDQMIHRQRPFLAVMADIQLQGRGTQGRAWEGGQANTTTGNLYLTVCVPYQEIPVQITLLPLQVAVLVAERAEKVISACSALMDDAASSSNQPPSSQPKVTVKWPNDVLINDHKLSGTLIESEVVDGTTYFLIGIGVNVAYAPDLANSPGKFKRQATCLQDHCSTTTTSLPPTTAAAFGSDLTHALVNWIMDKSDKERRERLVISQWKSFAEFDKQFELRGDVKEEDAETHVGEKVNAVDIQSDGQLVVRGEDGRERLLIADYLF